MNLNNATARAGIVRFHYEGKTRLGIVRNGAMRHAEPGLDLTHLRILTDALSRFPGLFMPYGDNPTHLDPMEIIPGRVAAGLFQGKNVTMALNGNLILNACDAETGEPLSDESLGDLQAAFDSFDRFFDKQTVAEILNACLVVTATASWTASGKTWPDITVLTAGKLVLAAVMTETPDVRLDIRDVQKYLTNNTTTVASRKPDAGEIPTIFPHLAADI